MKLNKRIIYLIIYGLGITMALNAHSLSNDSLFKKSKGYFEFRVGGILLLHGKGDNSDNITSSELSKSFNFSSGKRIKNISIGVNLDFTVFNVCGNAKTVGAEEWTGSGIRNVYNYLIKQNIRYSNFSLGLSSSYHFNFSKLFLDVGPSIYFIIYRSPLILSNSYVGGQPYNNNIPPPQENKNFIDIGYSGELKKRRFIPYFGANIDIGYNINSKLALKIYNACYYDFVVNIRGNTYGMLPQQSIYSIRKQYWINSGIAVVFKY